MQYIRPFDSLTLDDLALVGGKNASFGEMIREAAGRKIGICGQAPSDYPEIAALLVRAGIDSLSLSPDVVVATRLHVADLERGAEVGTRA